MAETIVYIATSLDGYIARKNGDVDWLIEDPSYDYYPSFISQIDSIVMGRGTYDKIISFGVKWPYPNKRTFVFTNNPVEDRNITCIHQNVVAFMDRFNKGDGKRIWIVGGGDLIRQFSQANLIDEIIISIQPVLLGNGIPLFSNNKAATLSLMDVTSYNKGSVQCHYRVEKKI